MAKPVHNRTASKRTEYAVNDVVQLSPECGKFAGCFMVVTEPKSFGAQGFVQVPGQGQAYYRANFEQMDFIGCAAFVLKRDEP